MFIHSYAYLYAVDDQRRHCLTPMHQVLTGDEFFRTTARYVRCDPKTVANCLDRVFAALEKLKPKYVRLPTAAEEAASAAEINQNKPFSGLPNLLKDKINLYVLVFLFINELRG